MGKARRHLSALVALGFLGVAALPALAAGDPRWDELWGIHKIGAEAAWAKSRGAGITIAVVDSGVHETHEDLAGKVVAGIDLVDDDDDPKDVHGHGTHVAGTAAAYVGNGRGVAGVAPDAKIMPVRVISEVGFNIKISPELFASVEEGIRWAVDNGAHVVNVSLGLYVPSFRGVLEYAWSKGVIVVISAGNEDEDIDATDEPAIIVAATDRNDQKAPYSNRVTEARWGLAAPGGGGSSVGFVANSERILSSWYDSLAPSRNDLYAYARGTSMAAPHVSGAAAVLRGAGLTPQQTVDRLLQTAKDLGATGRDPVFGAGRIDLAAAAEGIAVGAPSGPAPASGGTGQAAGGPVAGADPAPGQEPGSRRARGGEGADPTAAPDAEPEGTQPEGGPLAAEDDGSGGGSNALANAMVASVLVTAAAGALGYHRIRRGRATSGP